MFEESENGGWTQVITMEIAVAIPWWRLACDRCQIRMGGGSTQIEGRVKGMERQ